MFELGWEEARVDGVALVEWAERLGPLLPQQRLPTVTLSVEGEGRRAILREIPLRRPLNATRRAEFVHRAGWGDAGETPAGGRCLVPQIFPARRGSGTAVVMDAPPPQEDVRPFVRIGRHLIDLGLSAPAINAEDERTDSC